ncbi:MAG: hypothetical protein Ct9H90mP15_09050 [Candidatus Neomarinimicrobiota bacterium]|nr:MAG: hypothetical protein Ct9H90mP15_09050 [Candidatus Neomarinimicrobiota bacterium]
MQYYQHGNIMSQTDIRNLKDFIGKEVQVNGLGFSTCDQLEKFGLLS